MIRRLASTLGFTVPVVCGTYCILKYIGDIVLCVGPSMEPAIHNNDVVLTEHISSSEKLRKGDIVISKCPVDPEQHICKRVIALPGDRVNGPQDFIVPKGHVWLEGDNSLVSEDSRNYGPVPQGLLRGRVFFRIWPLSDIGILKSQDLS